MGGFTPQTPHIRHVAEGLTHVSPSRGSVFPCHYNKPQAVVFFTFFDKQKMQKISTAKYGGLFSFPHPHKPPKNARYTLLELYPLFFLVPS